jgi:cytoplasmic iron level regulating protein YaaA (DUF328/UPF0246 family)
MILLLSPAKTLDFSDSEMTDHSTPRLLEDTKKLVAILKKKSSRSLKKLMGVSDTIADLNVERFQKHETPFTLNNAKQAILAFKGDVYLGLQADTFDEADFNFAQNHLRILSGLYGLLTPLDLMQPYRLEMGTSLKNGRKKNLYEFWDKKITALINADLALSGNDIVLNLASQEYFHAVKPALVEGNLIHVYFKELRNGDYKVISFNAKKARGDMARQIIKNRINEANLIKILDVNGYQFNEPMSDKQNLVFTKEGDGL